MSLLHHFLASSNHWAARSVRSINRRLRCLTLPAPRLVVLPILAVYLFTQTVYLFARRVFICEPLFKARCTSFGRGVRTGAFVHWIQGAGSIVLGDDVLIDGKCTFSFAARFSVQPELVIGDGTGIGHNCSFTVGKRITIGRQCRIASDVWIFDSPGHPTDPADRAAGLPPLAKDVRPVTVGDNVWIGRRCILFPGVTVGEGSVISAGSVVMSDVPPYSIVAGNPARKIGALPTVPSSFLEAS